MREIYLILKLLCIVLIGLGGWIESTNVILASGFFYIGTLLEEANE